MDQNALLRFSGVTTSPTSSSLCKDGSGYINNPRTNHNSIANHAANPNPNPAEEGASHHHYHQNNSSILANFGNDHINTYLYMNQSAALRPHPTATIDPNHNSHSVNSCEDDDDANPNTRSNSCHNMMSNQLDPSPAMAVNHLFSGNSSAADNNINPSRFSSDNSHLINTMMEDQNHNHTQNPNHHQNPNHNNNRNHNPNHNHNHNYPQNHNHNHSSNNDDDTTTATPTNHNDDVKNNNNNNNNSNNDNRHKSNNASAVSAEDDDMNSQREKIVAHPYFPRLLHAYTNYYKIGAPAEVISRLDEIREEYNRRHHLRHHDDSDRHDSDPDDDPDDDKDRHHHALLLMASSAPPIATNRPASAVGDDPELDEFMRVYSEVLERQVGGISRCVEEAQAFLKRMEAQLLITLSSLHRPTTNSRNDPGGSNSNMNSGDEEDILEDGSCCEADYKNMNVNLMSMGTTNTNPNESELQQLQQQALLNQLHMNTNHNISTITTTNYNNDGNHTNKPNNAIIDNDDDDDDDENDDDGVDDEAKIRMNMGSMSGMIDPVMAHEDQVQLKQQLLRKYSGFMICSLKKEFLKRKKKGKLPKEARQKLLEWWTQHYKWPYPSENEKAALAEMTGLNQKQINNWFINQRKRHWKPSEDLHYVMIDSNDLHHSAPQMAMPNVHMNMNMNTNTHTNTNTNTNMNTNASAPNLHHNHNMSQFHNNNSHDILSFGQTSATNAATGLL